jgi:hypothetical protein
MISRRVYPPLWLAFTMILAGYLMVWLPQPVVGLSLMGLEMGEWVKFLPQVQAGSLPDRNLFYLPPITLSLMMIIWTAGWPNRRWQTWAARCGFLRKIVQQSELWGPGRFLGPCPLAGQDRVSHGWPTRQRR